MKIQCSSCIVCVLPNYSHEMLTFP